MKGFINIVILIALIIAIFFGFKSCQNTSDLTGALKGTTDKVIDSAKEAADQAGGALQALGDFFSVKLPSGVSLNIPEFGVEKKLIGFIKNGELSNESWFNFDRINFSTGSASLSAESSEQIKNIFEILKAYPNVKLKVGGYTDNTGSDKTNMQLSQARANTVKSAISSLGIDEVRLIAEGYGSAHPVATNETPEGRAQNRRISLRVIEK